MQSRERVEQFVQVVEAGEYLRAIEDFYHPNASMQENGAPPREGRDNLVAHERKFLASLACMRTRRVETVLIDGERVVINWVFEMTDGGGKTRTLDELALQLWQGDRILRERFYYDPSQLRSAD